MLTKELYKELDKDFPEKTAADWDYVGYQCGPKNIVITKIIVCLDLTTDVITKAIAEKANLIITHHPFLFTSLKETKQIVYKNQILNLLNQHKISVYAAHTNYDGLMNELILQELKAKKIIALPNDPITKIGNINLTAREVITKLKDLFKISTVQHNMQSLDNLITTIALTAGAGGDTINFLDDKIGLFITGEVKWNQWLTATEKNLNVVCFNHYMEDFFTVAFTSYLQRKFPSLDIIPYHVKNIITYE